MARLAAMSHLGFHRSFNFLARCLFEECIEEGMGKSITKLGTSPPAHIQEEIDEGHIRYIYLGRSFSENQAKCNIKSASDQLKKESTL